MLPVAVYGFHHRQLIPVVDQLIRDRTWQVKLWFGTGDQRSWTEDISEWHLGLLHGKSMLDDCDALDIDSANSIEQITRPEDFDVFVDQMARNPCMIDQPLARYQQLWHRLLQHFRQLLHDRSIKLVVFQNLPHEGFEWALYVAAKSLAIPTLLLYQTILAGRFSYCWSLDDFGEFESAIPDRKLSTVKFERRYEKELFYMANTASAVRGRRTAAIRRLTDRFAVFRDHWKSSAIWLKRVSGLDRLRDKSHRPYNPREQYEANLRRYSQRPDWNRRFVYFPLHLQPELTTSAIAGVYRDQLLALEHLRQWLPPDIWIYVKENPKQTERWRGPQFFRRLSQLPRTVLVDRSTDTYHLLRRCQFPATITGTIGWEAITGGKPVVVFGRSWYLTLAGVHRFHPCLSVDDLIASSVCPDELQSSLDRLAARFPAATVDMAYQKMQSTFDEAANRKQLASFFSSQTARLMARLAIGHGSHLDQAVPTLKSA